MIALVMSTLATLDQHPGEAALYIAMVVVGLSASAAFSGIETAVYQMSRLRLLVRERSGDERALLLHRETSETQRLLSTLLIGNNTVNFMTSFGLTAILTKLMGLGDWASIGAQALVLTPLLLIFGEVVPKEMCRAHADTVVYPAARFLRAVRLLFTWTGVLPFVEFLGDRVARWLGEAEGVNRPSARARVAALMSEGVGHGVLSENQTDLANRTLMMRDLPLQQIMTPWDSVVTLSAEMTVAELRDHMSEFQHSQYPVVNPRGEVIGVVSILRLLLVRARDRATVRIRDYAEPVTLLDPQSSARATVMRLRRVNATMAIVGGRRRPVGVVTLADLVEPLFTTHAT